MRGICFIGAGKMATAIAGGMVRKNIKTEITKIHYTRNPEGILFDFPKFCSYIYGFGSRVKNYLYDKKILKSKKVNAYVISVGNIT